MAGLGAGMGLFMCGLFMRLQGGLLHRAVARCKERVDGRGERVSHARLVPRVQARMLGDERFM
ncbi:MAG: hypothetical protein RI897_4387 [Verrucomicrobiota bacterium]|jgi:hypothetical protein